MRADQRQDENSHLEKGDKLMFDGREKGSTIAALSFSGDFWCLDPAFISCFTPRVTLFSGLIFALAVFQGCDL